MESLNQPIYSIQRNLKTDEKFALSVCITY
jgi:hypothetical protein